MYITLREARTEDEARLWFLAAHDEIGAARFVELLDAVAGRSDLSEMVRSVAAEIQVWFGRGRVQSHQMNLPLT